MIKSLHYYGCSERCGDIRTVLNLGIGFVYDNENRYLRVVCGSEANIRSNTLVVVLLSYSCVEFLRCTGLSAYAVAVNVGLFGRISRKFKVFAHYCGRFVGNGLADNGRFV